MKRNTESKYRQKIINECNLSKGQQKELDRICKNHRCGYSLVYREMPYGDNRKKIYIKKLFKLYYRKSIFMNEYCTIDNLFVSCHAARLLTVFIKLEG